MFPKADYPAAKPKAAYLEGPLVTAGRIVKPRLRAMATTYSARTGKIVLRNWASRSIASGNLADFLFGSAVQGQEVKAEGLARNDQAATFLNCGMNAFRRCHPSERLDSRRPEALLLARLFAG